MKLPLSWSPKVKKPHLRVPDRNQNRGEQLLSRTHAQQHPWSRTGCSEPALGKGWKVKSHGSCWVPAVPFTPVCFTHAWEFSFTAPLWGRKLLPPLQKWGVMRWPSSPGRSSHYIPGTHRKSVVKLRMNLISHSLLCAYGLLTPPSFLQAVSSLGNRQSQSGFSPLSCLSELYRLAQTAEICCPVVRSPYLEQSTRETKLSCKAQH